MELTTIISQRFAFGAKVPSEAKNWPSVIVNQHNSYLLSYGVYPHGSRKQISGLNQNQDKTGQKEQNHGGPIQNVGESGVKIHLEIQADEEKKLVLKTVPENDEEQLYHREIMKMR